MPSLAQGMEAGPGPDSLAYWLQPFKKWRERQAMLAQAGSDQADMGAQQVRGGDLPAGLANMLMGPLAFISSPATALLPTEQEVYNAPDLPESVKPGIAGGLGLAAMMIPGNKAGMRPLGRGVGSLVDDVTDAERAALAGRLEAEAGQTGGAASSATRDEALRKLTGAPEGITAYHASPHVFDKFDMSRIGTGEGNQAFGHGLYFAENPKVSGRGGEYDLLFQERMRESIAPEISKAANFLAGSDGDRALAVRKLEAYMKYATRPEDQTAVRKAIEMLRSDKPIPDPVKANIYEVRLNVKPDELLDWDRPLSEQPKVVRDLFANDAAPSAYKRADVPIDPKAGVFTDMSRTGGQLYESSKLVPGDFRDSPAASAKLKAAGIKGIRYKDAGSRGAEGGTYNYVIFDDKLVDILKRYGVAITAGAGGAAIVSGQDMPPEVAAQLGPDT